MRQKTILIPTFIAFLIVISGSIYFYYFSKPSDFLSGDELTEKINSYYRSQQIEIQDVIILEDKHAYVPFISDGIYGSSFWTWKKRSWELVEINTIPHPKVWKIDPNDPSTYVVVWNFDTDSDTTEFDFYLVNRRGYWISNNVHQYTPRVQLKVTVPFADAETSYGVKHLPDDWITFLESYLQVENSKRPQSSFFSFFEPSRFNFSWMPYDQNGDISFPNAPNGTGFGFGNINLHHVSNIPDYELE